jgi:hypothetical protein
VQMTDPAVLVSTSGTEALPEEQDCFERESVRCCRQSRSPQRAPSATLYFLDFTPLFRWERFATALSVLLKRPFSLPSSSVLVENWLAVADIAKPEGGSAERGQ